jgi:drug/metabolite transporter (DMT)-like permease
VLFRSLLSGMIAGMAIIFIKKARKTDNSFTIFFYLSVIGALISIAPTLYGIRIPSLYEIILLVSLSSAGTIGQLLMTYAFKFSGATEGGILTLSTVVFSVMEGAWFFKEIISIYMLIGTSLIIFASIMILLPRKEGK